MYYSNTNRFLSWFQTLVIECYDRTDCGTLFHSVGEAISKPRLPMAFIGPNVERHS